MTASRIQTTLGEIGIVTGNLIIVNVVATGNLTFPSLYVVEGYISVRSNSNSLVVQFPALRQAKRNIVVRENTGVTDVHFDALVDSGGSFYFTSNDALRVITAPLLLRVNSFMHITDNEELRKLVLPNLQAVTSYLWIEGGNAALEEAGSIQMGNVCAVETLRRCECHASLATRLAGLAGRTC